MLGHFQISTGEFVTRSWRSLREVAHLLSELKALPVTGVDVGWSAATEGLLPQPCRTAQEAALSGSKMQIRQFFGVLLHGCPAGEGRQALDQFLALHARVFSVSPAVSPARMTPTRGRGALE